MKTRLRAFAAGIVAAMNYASWPRRVLAAIVDGTIVFTVVLPLVVAALLLQASDSEAAAALLWLVALAVGVLYAPLLLQRSGERNGQTWGKQLVGIRVVRDDGEQVTFGYALLRELVLKDLLFSTVGSLLLYIPFLANYLWPLWDKENRALHDMIVKSHVVGSEPPAELTEQQAEEGSEASSDQG